MTSAHPPLTAIAPAVTRGLPDLSLGYVPLTDAAPLLVAEEKGFFRRHGLRVALAPAASWAALRDRVAFGVWDGAQMLAPMPIAAVLGLGGVRAAAVVTATQGRNGNTLCVRSGAGRRNAGRGLPRHCQRCRQRYRRIPRSPWPATHPGRGVSILLA